MYLGARTISFRTGGSSTRRRRISRIASSSDDRTPANVRTASPCSRVRTGGCSKGFPRSETLKTQRERREINSTIRHLRCLGNEAKLFDATPFQRTSCISSNTKNSKGLTFPGVLYPIRSVATRLYKRVSVRWRCANVIELHHGRAIFIYSRVVCVAARRETSEV